MAAERVERRIWIDAPPEVVYGLFVDPAALVRWQGERASVEVGVGGQYRIGLGTGEAVVGRFLELVPSRRLVFTWALTLDDGELGPATTVVVTLAPQGFGTAVRVVHAPESAAREREGGDMAETEEFVLYDRRAPDGGFQCEWCGRPGQPLPFHVQSPNGEVEFGEPVLCAVCQGLLGYLHPHRGQQPQPPFLSPEQAEEEPAVQQRLTPEERRAAAHARHQEVHEWASGVVSRLLTERFVSEGRPRPAWASGPGWIWPPPRRAAPVED